MKIKINEEEIELKQTFRTLMLYENATNQSFQNNGNMTNLLLYFYCNILASREYLDLSFEDFIDFIDANPNVLSEYLAWLNKNSKIQDAFTEKDTKAKSKKKE